MIKNIILQGNFFKFAYRLTRWHLRYFAGRNALPLACGFYLTSKCNFGCEFCNIWRIKPAFQVPFEEARNLIGQLGRMGLIYFSFSGGEPLLVPYVFDLLAHAKKSGILYTHMVSNGFLMDSAMARKIAQAKLSEISFSLDGDEESHDRKRAVKGAYSKVIESVEHVKNFSPATGVVLNTILDPLNPEDALSAIKTAAKLAVKIKVQPLNDHPAFGAGEAAIKSKRQFSAQEKDKLLGIIDSIKHFPHVVNSKPFLENYKAFLFYPEKLIFARDDCIFGYHHIEFFANQMFPCLEGMNWEGGFKASGMPLAESLESLPYRNKLQLLKKCPCCKKNYYICYYEPRIHFPLWNFLKSRW